MAGQGHDSEVRSQPRRGGPKEINMTQHKLGGRTGDSFRIGAAILLLVWLGGCSKSAPLDPNSKQSAIAGVGSDAATAGFGTGAFYPLALGNSWEYEGSSRLVFVNPDGSPGGDPIETQLVESDRIIGTEVRNGVSYFVREEVLNESPDPYTGQWITWSRMRQDRSGLYAADVNSDEPPALESSVARDAPAGAKPGRPTLDVETLEQRGFSKASAAAFADRLERLREAARGWVRAADATRASQEGELTWLLYPLHVGVEWNIRPDMPWPARVDQVERIDSKMGPLTAYRIETNPLGAPLPEGEFVRLFYGRVGYIGYSIHSSFQAADENGQPTGVTAIVDEVRLLTATGQNSALRR